jgi:Cdc6-like AAA superfamily ATPase
MEKEKMPKIMSQWFSFRPEFTSFVIDAERHSKYLFGNEDRALRDELVLSLKECSYSQRGQHAIIYGNAGRGKTHLANHLVWSARNAKDDEFALELVYVDCPPISSAKAPISSFFANILRSVPIHVVKRIVNSFLKACETNPTAKDRVTKALQNNGSIYSVLESMGIGTEKYLKSALGWLGGEVEPQIATQFEVPKQLTDEGQITRNIAALAEMLLVGEGKNLIFLIDEAERLQTITSGEQYYVWLSALRQLFRKPPLGLILFVIAKNRDDVPQVLWEEEISSVIGTNNIHECSNFAKQQAESFLKELLECLIDRTTQTVVDAVADAGEKVETYPFTAEAFDDFVTHHTIGTSTSIPREIINSLERSARRAMTLNKKLIDSEVLRQVIEGI